MRICIFGAGAVGGNLAARLAQAGNQVCVVARGENLTAIRDSGLTVRFGGEEIREKVQASDRPADFGVQDVVISTLKAGSLTALAAGIGPLLGAETSVVFAQNGIPWWYALGLAESATALPDLSALDPGGILARSIPRASIIAGIVYSANSVVAPGVIENASAQNNRVLLANIDDGESSRLSALRKMLTDAAIQSPVVTNVRTAIWQKLIVNLVSGMTVLVQEPTSTMLADPKMREVAERLVSEATNIASAYRMEVHADLSHIAVGKKSSILQDYESGRPMEVESQFLAPLAFARSANIAVPTLDTVANTIAHLSAAKGLYTPPKSRSV